MTELTQLLEKLAEKLGTTTEYLWGVLITQAHISAITSLIYIILFILFGGVLYKVHKKWSQKIREDSNYTYYDHDEWCGPFMVVCCALFFIFSCVIVIHAVPNIINGFFNPEYWALNHILENI